MSKSYSGRGMYGRQTYSLNLPDMTYLAMLAAVVKRADREDFALEIGVRRDRNPYRILWCCWSGVWTLPNA